MTLFGEGGANTFAALADAIVGEELSQGPLIEADNKEEIGQDPEASSENGYVPLSCLDAAYPYCILMRCIRVLLIR